MQLIALSQFASFTNKTYTGYFMWSIYMNIKQHYITKIKQDTQDLLSAAVVIGTLWVNKKIILGVFWYQL